MSRQREDKPNDKRSRIKVNDLPRPEETLRESEARQVKSGGQFQESVRQPQPPVGDSGGMQCEF